MSVDPAQAAGQRKAIALVTAVQTCDEVLIAAQLNTVVADGDVLEVLVAMAAAHVGLIRSVAEHLGRTPEDLIQRTALYWQDPPL